MSSDFLIRWMHFLKAEGSFVHDVAFARLVDSSVSGTSVETRPDFIFCTGDVAFNGQAKEKEIATQFFYWLPAAFSV